MLTVQRKLIAKLKEIRKDLVDTQLYLRKNKRSKNTTVSHKIHYINAILDLYYGKTSNEGYVSIGSVRYNKRVPVESLGDIQLQKFCRRMDREALVHLVDESTYTAFKCRVYTSNY